MTNYHCLPLQIIPQIDFSELKNLSPSDIERIKQRVSVVIRNVVDQSQATAWKKELEEFVKVNPVEGMYISDIQTIVENFSSSR